MSCENNEKFITKQVPNVNEKVMKNNQLSNRELKENLPAQIAFRLFSHTESSNCEEPDVAEMYKQEAVHDENTRGRFHKSMLS